MSRSNQRNVAGLIARQRVYQPWPDHLDYENDDDFYAWYTGEYLPTEEEILLKCIEIVDAKLPEETSIECDGGDDWEWQDPSDINLFLIRASLAHR